MTQSLGSIVPRSSGDPGYLLQFERVYPTTIDDLWEAVTDPQRLSRWMAPYTGDLILGGTWSALSDDGSVFVTGRVRACSAPDSFETTWHAVEENETMVSVRLSSVEGGTRLSLSHDGIGSLDYAAGWHTYFDLLDLDVAGDFDGIASFDWGARYGELRPLYRLPA